MRNPFAFTQEVFDAADGKWPAKVRGDRRPRPVSIQVFESKLVEFFGTSHWFLPVVWFGPFIVYGVYRGVVDGFSAALIAALYAAGVLLWTLIEYVLHRFLFHWEPGDSADGRLRAFIMHGYHHEFANDRLRLVAPPVMSWPVGAILAGLFYLAFGRFWWPAVAGMMTGYVAYDWIHYYSHHARPTTAVGKWIRHYHLRHHYEDHNSRFGVSSPLWDFVFGTYRPLKKVATVTSDDLETASNDSAA